jgi:hypothetical protein
MKAFYRLLGCVSYDHINEAMARIVQDEEYRRNENRKLALIEIEKLDIKNDAEKIQKTLINMNRDLTTSYEKEKFLLEFINLIKS